MCRISFAQARPIPETIALVAQERVQPPRLGRQDLAEPLCAEAERLRAEVLELLLGRFGREQPDAARFFGACLGQDELAAALEAEPERRRLRARLARAQVADAACGHQVDEQHELAVLGREEQPLGAPLGSCKPPALERAESGGSNVFSVAMCAGPARSIGNALTGSLSARRQRLYLG